MRSEISYLKEQLEWFKRQIFGKRSEKIVSDLDSNQLCFEGFSGAQQKEPSSTTVPEHERKKPNRNGQDKIQLPSDLPVETIILDLPEEEKICKETGNPLMGMLGKAGFRFQHLSIFHLNPLFFRLPLGAGEKKADSNGNGEVLKSRF